MARRISFRACAPRVFSIHGRAFWRAGMTAQASRAAMTAQASRAAMAAGQPRVSYAPSALTLPIGWPVGIWFSNSGSIGASPTRLPVTSIALISSASASMPRCTLRHCLDLAWAWPELGLAWPGLGRPVFPSEPRAFALRLDPGAVDQEMQCTRAGAIRNGDVQTARTARQRAEVRHRPLELGKVQQACHQPCGLPQRQPEQRLQRQACLNCRVAEPDRAAPLSAGLGKPHRLRIKPDMQRSALLQDGVARTPVRGAAGRRCGLAHPSRPTLWSHAGNPW